MTSLPQLTTHVYWQSKANFQLDKDTYDMGVIFAVENGSFRYEIGTQRGIAEFGDIVICPPHTLFRRETISPLSFHFMIFDFQHTEDDLSNIPSGKVHIKNTSRLHDNYVQLQKKNQIHPILPSYYKQHIFLDLWFMALDEQASSLYKPNFQQQDALMLKAATYLQDHAFGQIKIKQLARQLELTQIQLTRRFYKAFQVNPIDYLTSIRLHKAAGLLTESDRTLDQIAADCGYESGFYLSRLFSKHMGMSPSEFRRKHRL